MKHFNSILIALTLIISSTACSNKKSEPSATDPGGGKGGEKLSGPNISGNWVSDCVRGELGGYSRFVLTIADANIQNEEISYNEDTCTNQVSTQVLKGTFTFEKLYSENVYLIKYFIPIDANISTWRYQKIKFENNLLSVSGLRIEDTQVENLEANIQLKPAGSTPPEEKTPDEPDQEEVIELRSGYYAPPSDSTWCEQSISTAKRNGVIAQVYVDLQGSCSGQLVLECEGNVCTSSQYKIEFKSETSYLFSDLQDSSTAAVFTRQ